MTDPRAGRGLWMKLRRRPATNAVFAREMVRESRNLVHFTIGALCVAGLTYFVVFHWEPPRGGVSSASTFRGLGRGLFTAYAFGQYAVVVLLGVVRAARFSEERREGRLALLQITRLSEGGVVRGEFSSLAVRNLVTMLLGAPLLVLGTAFGGFTFTQAWHACVITFCAGCQAVAITMMTATTSRSGAATATVSAVVQAIWFAGVAVSGAGESQPWLHSYVALKEIVAGETSGQVLMAVTLSRLASVGVLMAVTSAALKREIPRPGRAIRQLLSQIDRVLVGKKRKRATLRQGGLPPLEGNPILWRERAVSLVGRRDHLIRFVYLAVGAIVLSLGAGFAIAGLDFIVSAGILAFFAAPLFLLVLVTVVPPATAFAQEHSSGALSVLAATPLKARTIVWGKFLAGLRLVVLPVVLLAAASALVFFVREKGTVRRAVTELSLLSTALPLAAMILYVGVGAKNVAGGIGAGFIVLVCAVVSFGHNPVGLPVFDSIFGAVHRSPYVGLAAFILAAGVLLRNTRLMSNTLVLAGFLAVPYIVLVCLSQRFIPIATSHKAKMMVVNYALIGTAVAFSAILLKGRYLPFLLVGGLALSCAAYVSDQYLVMIDWLMVVEVLLVLLFACATYWVKTGVPNRTGLTIAFIFAVETLFFQRSVHYRVFWTKYELSMVNCAFLVAISLAVTALFLVNTSRQLDGLMERHG